MILIEAVAAMFENFLSRFRWYRRYVGGRWEYHYIDICASSMWLHMNPDKCWPQYRQPCSVGTPIVEDWP